MKILDRPIEATAFAALTAAQIPAALARLYAARGVSHPADVDYAIAQLPAATLLKNAPQAAALLVDAILQRRRMLVIADYDADGATACAVALRGIRLFGGIVDFLVPNRFEFGYGLTPAIVDLAATRAPDLIITVDNGIASVDGVARAHALGIPVLITDHHLPGDTLPDAAAIVNPNQPGCGFQTKQLAGVGVLFYVLLATRARLRELGHFTTQTQPNLGWTARSRCARYRRRCGALRRRQPNARASRAPAHSRRENVCGNPRLIRHRGRGSAQCELL